jgi:hypothetical protein
MTTVASRDMTPVAGPPWEEMPAVPPPSILHRELLAAEYAIKVALLAPHIDEPAMRADIALMSISGTPDELYQAAAEYSLPMLRALIAMSDTPHEQTIFWAVQVGNLACLRYAHEHGAVWSRGTAETAAFKGHLACLRYAAENGCPLNSHLIIAAAKGGHVDCMRYISAHLKCPWHAKVQYWAARRGHLACLRYAHKNGCPWDRLATMAAAEAGNLACLRYLHEHGCPWGPETTQHAALMGHLECLEYAHQNGCRLHEDAGYYAASGKHLECLQYVQKFDNPWVFSTTPCLTAWCCLRLR